MSEASNPSQAETPTGGSPPATRDRETRPDEVAEAVMFAAAGGLSLEPEAVVHGASHVCRTGEEQDPALRAVAVVSHDADPPTRVTLHGEDLGEADPTPRRLLDLSLMKLGAEGARTIRVQSSEATEAALWSASDWIAGLPDLNDATRSRRWEDALAGSPGDVIEVVRRALARAESALRGLAEQTQNDDAHAEPSASG
ncbi:MAG: hypothetical protein AAGE65_09390 [Planctomycetota bacterium]